MKIIPDVAVPSLMLSVLPDTNARSAAALMLDRKSSSVIVVDDAGKLLGIVTDRDLTRAFVVGHAPMETTTVVDLMTVDPDTIGENDHPRDALELMELRGFRHLPVVDAEGRALAVVTILDLYDAINRSNQEILARTQQYIFGERFNPEI